MRGVNRARSFEPRVADGCQSLPSGAAEARPQLRSVARSGGAVLWALAAVTMLASAANTLGATKVGVYLNFKKSTPALALTAAEKGTILSRVALLYRNHFPIADIQFSQTGFPAASDVKELVVFGDFRAHPKLGPAVLGRAWVPGNMAYVNDGLFWQLQTTGGVFGNRVGLINAIAETAAHELGHQLRATHVLDAPVARTFVSGGITYRGNGNAVTIMTHGLLVLHADRAAGTRVLGVATPGQVQNTFNMVARGVRRWTLMRGPMGPPFFDQIKPKFVEGNAADFEIVGPGGDQYWETELTICAEIVSGVMPAGCDVGYLNDDGQLITLIPYGESTGWFSADDGDRIDLVLMNPQSGGPVATFVENGQLLSQSKPLPVEYALNPDTLEDASQYWQEFNLGYDLNGDGDYNDVVIKLDTSAMSGINGMIMGVHEGAGGTACSPWVDNFDGPWLGWDEATVNIEHYGWYFAEGRYVVPSITVTSSDDWGWVELSRPLDAPMGFSASLDVDWTEDTLGNEQVVALQLLDETGTIVLAQAAVYDGWIDDAPWGMGYVADVGYGWTTGALPLSGSANLRVEVSGTGAEVCVNGDMLIAGDMGFPGASMRIIISHYDEPSSDFGTISLDHYELAPSCAGDLNFDDVVGLSDLAMLLANYGASGGASYPEGNLDGDCDVDLSDLATLLSVYGTVCD